MQTEFKAAMLKLSLLGHSQANLIDCSEVIPANKALVGSPHLPAGLAMSNIEQAVSIYQALEYPILTVPSVPRPRSHRSPRIQVRPSSEMRFFPCIHKLYRPSHRCSPRVSFNSSPSIFTSYELNVCASAAHPHKPVFASFSKAVPQLVLYIPVFDVIL